MEAGWCSLSSLCGKFRNQLKYHLSSKNLPNHPMCSWVSSALRCSLLQHLLISFIDCLKICNYSCVYLYFVLPIRLLSSWGCLFCSECSDKNLVSWLVHSKYSKYLLNERLILLGWLLWVGDCTKWHRLSISTLRPWMYLAAILSYLSRGKSAKPH